MQGRLRSPAAGGYAATENKNKRSLRRTFARLLQPLVRPSTLGVAGICSACRSWHALCGPPEAPVLQVAQMRAAEIYSSEPKAEQQSILPSTLPQG